MTPHVSLPGMMRDERLLTPKISELFKKEIHFAKISDYEKISELAFDVLCTLEFYELMHTLLENSKLEIIEDARRLPILEQIKMTTMALASWLEDI